MPFLTTSDERYTPDGQTVPVGAYDAPDEIGPSAYHIALGGVAFG